MILNHLAGFFAYEYTHENYMLLKLTKYIDFKYCILLLLDLSA